MTVHYPHGKIALSCDGCPETYEATATEFREALDEAKAEGWRAYKVGNDWEHLCPDCKRKS